MPTLSAVALPDHLDPSFLQGRIAVVIDVLRATSTIVRALEQGASCVIPVASIDAARLISHERKGSLLCGERSGIKPDGFNLGNSPLEYTSEKVRGRDLVLSTTNGTRALRMCEDAHRIYTASITNLAAVCAEIEDHEQDVVIVCSGTDLRVSLEDCICAGLIASRMSITHETDDSALLMVNAAEGAIERNSGFERAIASSFHARRLIDLGFADDVNDASRLSTSSCVPCFDPVTGEIRPVPQLKRSHG